MKKFILILIIFSTYTIRAHAADVSIVAPKTIESSKPFNITIALDTGGVSINSVDITMSYPKSILSFKGYKEEGSISKLWLTPPTNTDGSVHLSGIIPGGVDGLYDPDKNGLQAIPIITLIFSPMSNGDGEFVITKSEILKNDGKGTALVNGVKNAYVSISNIKTPDKEDSVEKNKSDLNPPEPFTIEYIVAGFFSKTPSMIVFSTTDKESGVEKYQLLSSDKWKDVVSPLPMTRTLLKREVTIRALDFDGNQRESKVEIPGLVSTSQLFSIIVLGILCYFIYFVVKRKR